MFDGLLAIDEAHRAEAIALGRAWADELAERYRDETPAADWPDFWDDADDGPLPTNLRPEQRAAMKRVAHRAAHERWIELVADQRAAESIDEDTLEREAAAAQLEATLRRAVPSAIGVGRDGSRAFLLLGKSGVERTVSSLEDAWRVVEEWSEQRRAPT
jgi:hypothetical protein